MIASEQRIPQGKIEKLFWKMYGRSKPDAIITATAIKKSAKLVTRDAQLNRVTELRVLSW